MSQFYLQIRHWFGGEKGQDLIEYAMLVFLLVVAAVITLGAVGTEIDAMFQKVLIWLGGTAAATPAPPPPVVVTPIPTTCCDW